MSRKRINRQDSSVDARPHKVRSKAKNRDAKKSAAKNPVPKSFPARSRVIAAFAIGMMMIATTAILAQRGQPKTPTMQNHAEQDKNASQPGGELSPESLTSPSLWSKEYIHGPGGKVIATEERLTFSDVADGSQYFEDIYRIAARGITLGCDPTVNPPPYCPDHHTNDPPTYGYVTRQEMAAFIMRALGEFNPPTPQSQRFIDVPPSNPFYNFIDRIAVLSITLGCTQDHTQYCPAGLVTHQEMAAFIDRAIGMPTPPPPPTQPTFCDVPTNNVFYGHIEYYANSRQPIIWPGCDGVGLCNPCGTCSTSGTVRCFSPGNNVTRRQMAHILVKAFGI
jgi:hypothetical protein